MRLDSDAPVDRVVHAMSKRLTFAENIHAVELTVPDTGNADVEFTVQHKLGKTPRLYLYNIDRAGVVYDSRRSEWTTSEMFLKCSTANCSLVMTVT